MYSHRVEFMLIFFTSSCLEPNPLPPPPDRPSARHAFWRGVLVCLRRQIRPA